MLHHALHGNNGWMAANGEWTPSSISGLVSEHGAHYYATDMTVGAGNLISAWNDHIRVSPIDAVQGSDSYKPRLDANVQNGLHGVYTGTQVFLSASSPTLITTGNAWSLFLTFKTPSSISGSAHITAYKTGEGKPLYFGVLSTWDFYISSYNNYFISNRFTPLLSGDTTYNILIVYDGVSPTSTSSYQVFINGGTATVGAAIGAADYADINVLCSSNEVASKAFASGFILHQGVYNKALSAGEITQFHTGINGIWNIY